MKLATLAAATVLLLSACAAPAAPAIAPPAEPSDGPKATDCLTAMADAEKLVDLTAQGAGLAAEGFDAVSRGDTAALDRMTAKVNELSPRVTIARAAYDASAKACKAAVR